MESKAGIPYPKAQECLTEWAKEGRKYCKDEHVELTASEIGNLTVKSSKGDARFPSDCHTAIAEQNADFIICPEHSEL